jgi:hypothetical protein
VEVAVELRAVRVTGRERRMPDAVLLGLVSPGRLPRRLQLLHKTRHCQVRAPLESRASLGAHNELRRGARAAMLGRVRCHAAHWPPRPRNRAAIRAARAQPRSCTGRVSRVKISKNKIWDVDVVFYDYPPDWGAEFGGWICALGRTPGYWCCGDPSHLCRDCPFPASQAERDGLPMSQWAKQPGTRPDMGVPRAMGVALQL